MPSVTQRVTPFLWFDGRAEEAAKFYTSIFPNSKIRTVSRYDDATAKAAGRPPGAVMTVDFVLDGQEFVALNGGPEFHFTEAISLMVSCDTQAEIDHFWSRLSADGGQEVQCGWLKDKFGLSWQVVPRMLMDLLTGDPERAKRVMAKVMTMKKLDLAAMTSA
jgi:predicted 3-demethylubiquinone-9 3-methyltransferase (glyoxalase superfamily)